MESENFSKGVIILVRGDSTDFFFRGNSAQKLRFISNLSVRVIKREKTAGTDLKILIKHEQDRLHHCLLHTITLHFK